MTAPDWKEEAAREIATSVKAQWPHPDTNRPLENVVYRAAMRILARHEPAAAAAAGDVVVANGRRFHVLKITDKDVILCPAPEPTSCARDDAEAVALELEDAMAHVAAGDPCVASGWFSRLPARIRALSARTGPDSVGDVEMRALLTEYGDSVAAICRAISKDYVPGDGPAEEQELLVPHFKRKDRASNAICQWLLAARPQPPADAPGTGGIQ